jgi:hypothetical protein
MDDKTIINEVLDFLKFKVNSDSCTPEELRNLSDILTERLDTIGTVEEISEFFNVPQQNLRTMINRKVSDKPKRRVYYRFMSIMKNIPEKWLRHK